MTLRNVARAVAWYLREVTGENDYDRYVAHMRGHDSDTPVLSRRDFERWKADVKEGTSAARCC